MSTPNSRLEKTKAAANLALVNEFVSKYRARITRGLSVYGEFNPAVDKRVLSHEAIEEILDVGSYLEMLEEKHPSLTSGIQKIRAKAIMLYGELKKLCDQERTLTREGDL